jgi:LPS-assembly lipoprotein
MTQILKNAFRLLAAAAGAALLHGCGFQPLYATNDGSAPGLRNVALSTVSAPEEITPMVTRAFSRRTSAEPAAAAYDLQIIAKEQAERLAVQIDASVTRYNYRLVGRYTLTERSSGKRYAGSVVSIASFNVVNSQYSTLFAEEAAREKAANQLVEDVEHDILLKLAAANEAATKGKQ